MFMKIYYVILSRPARGFLFWTKGLYKNYINMLLFVIVIVGEVCFCQNVLIN